MYNNICNCSLVFLQVMFTCDVLRPGDLTCPKKDLLQFESLSSLSQPFHSTGCFQMFCNSELAVMRESICSLEKEIVELKIALVEMNKEFSKAAEVNVSTSDGKMVRRGKGRGGRGGGDERRNRQGIGKEGWDMKMSGRGGGVGTRFNGGSYNGRWYHKES